MAIKNVVDFAIEVALYWGVGFGLMFGASKLGWLGLEGFMPEVGHGSTNSLTAFFLFQAMFCSTAATIVSGAVAERMRFAAYLLVAALVAGLIYRSGTFAAAFVCGECATARSRKKSR